MKHCHGEAFTVAEDKWPTTWSIRTSFCVGFNAPRHTMTRHGEAYEDYTNRETACSSPLRSCRSSGASRPDQRQEAALPFLRRKPSTNLHEYAGCSDFSRI